jgi:hypothetical protein
MGEREILGAEGDGEPPAGLDERTVSQTLGVDGGSGPDKLARRMRCRVGLHHWETRRTEVGGLYRTCTICDEDEYNAPLFTGLDPHPR